MCVHAIMTPRSMRVSKSGPDLSISVTRTAVCVVGAIRTFDDPQLRRSWEQKFHEKGYEYFFSVDYFDMNSLQDQTFPTDEVVRRVSLIPEVDIVIPKESECHANGTKMHFYMLPYIVRMTQCANMIEESEQITGTRYEFVARLRPDLIFFEKFPRVSTLVRRYEIEHASGIVVLFDDQMAFARRSDLDIIFRYPRLAYRCHGVRDWAVACNVSSETDSFTFQTLKSKVVSPNHDVPCPPMNLIAVYAYKYALNSTLTPGSDSSEGAIRTSSVKQCGHVWSTGCHMGGGCHMDVLRPNGKTREGCLTKITQAARNAHIQR